MFHVKQGAEMALRRGDRVKDKRKCLDGRLIVGTHRKKAFFLHDLLIFSRITVAFQKNLCYTIHNKVVGVSFARGRCLFL